MKFSELLFFYAIINCPSGYEETTKKRSLAKEHFKIILNLSKDQRFRIPTIAQNFPQTESDIKTLLGECGSENHIKIIKTFIDEIKNNVDAVFQAIEEDLDNETLGTRTCEEYLDERLSIEYPEIKKHEEEKRSSDASEKKRLASSHCALLIVQSYPIQYKSLSPETPSSQPSVTSSPSSMVFINRAAPALNPPQPAPSTTAPYASTFGNSTARDTNESAALLPAKKDNDACCRIL